MARVTATPNARALVFDRWDILRELPAEQISLHATGRTGPCIAFAYDGTTVWRATARDMVEAARRACGLLPGRTAQ